MVFPENFLSIERIALDIEAGSKKRVLEQLAALLQSDRRSLEGIFDQLLERERLGSTGMGHGIALPHARIDGLTQALGGFIRLADGVDFGAIDGAAVDLVFGLLVPGDATEEHLQLLATLAGLFRNPEFCIRLRQAPDPQHVLHALLSS
jgi:PTS system nitrogen regulatory IIA component